MLTCSSASEDGAWTSQTHQNGINTRCIQTNIYIQKKYTIPLSWLYKARGIKNKDKTNIFFSFLISNICSEIANSLTVAFGVNCKYSPYKCTDLLEHLNQGDLVWPPPHAIKHLQQLSLQKHNICHWTLSCHSLWISTFNPFKEPLLMWTSLKPSFHQVCHWTLHCHSLWVFSLPLSTKNCWCKPPFNQVSIMFIPLNSQLSLPLGIYLNLFQRTTTDMILPEGVG